jgi:ApbE superfamily uncharacterized protein (UPF0280 family)
VKQKKKRKRTGPASYQHRTYRQTIEAKGLVSTFVKVQQTDLHILAAGPVEEQAYEAVFRYRNQLENYLAKHPDFLTALTPLRQDPLATPLIRAMLDAAREAGVGPMAAVAGAIAEFVGRDLLAAGEEEIVVENGGDIFLKRREECIVSIFAGRSPLSGKAGIRIAADTMPIGICTSSGAVGHSLSLGRADSVTVLAPSATLADAVATRIGNEVTGSEEIDRALRIARDIPLVLGAVIILGGRLGAWGQVDLVQLS